MKALAVGVAVLVLGGAEQTPRLAGCSMFPANNAWNLRVDSLPVASNSDAIIASIGAGTGLHPDFGSGKWAGGPIGIPYDVVDGKTTRRRASRFEYADESDPGPYPIPTKVHIEHGSDRHALIARSRTCKLYELFALERTRGAEAGSGAIWNLRSNALRPVGWTSADAAGLPILPGLARYDEVAARLDRPCAPVHGPPHAKRVRLPGAALRERPDRPEPAADGPARPPEGERRHGGFPRQARVVLKR